MRVLAGTRAARTSRACPRPLARSCPAPSRCAWRRGICGYPLQWWPRRTPCSKRRWRFFCPTPGRRSSSSRDRGTSPAWRSSSSRQVAMMFLALLLYRPIEFDMTAIVRRLPAPAWRPAYWRCGTIRPWPCSRSCRSLGPTGSRPPRARTATGSAIRCAAPGWPPATVRILRAASHRSRHRIAGAERGAAAFFASSCRCRPRRRCRQALRVRLEAHAVKCGLIRRGLRPRPHFDAIDGAGRQAQLAARAALGSTVCMYLAAPTMASTGQGGRQRAQPMQRDSSIHATSGGCSDAMRGIQGQNGAAQEIRQGSNGGAAARRALVDLRLAAGDRRGVGYAPA